MKIKMEEFDFNSLKPESVLLVEVSEGTQEDIQSALKTVDALKKFKKIPAETLCLVVSRKNSICLREIPESMMNEKGWFKKTTPQPLLKSPTR